MKNVLVFSLFALLVISLVAASPYITPTKNIEGVKTVFVPAIDSEGNGVLGKFEVQVIPGNGKTLTNIDHLLYFVDTQFSIQTAKAVAANITGVDISKYNIAYDISVDFNGTQVIGGPSAGAALAVATVAALENKNLNPEIMITGEINPDGTIGKVGGVPSKSKAAQMGGAKILLVPVGQGLKSSFKVDTSCERSGTFKICRTSYNEQPTLGVNEDGLIIREVGNIGEALKYFLQ